MPTWVYDIQGCRVEKIILMPFGRNTVYVSNKLLEGSAVEMKARPYCACRKHDSQLGYPHRWPFNVTFQQNHYEVTPFEGAPVTRMTISPFNGDFSAQTNIVKND